MGTLHHKSSPYQVWCLFVLWRWRYSISILSRDIKWPHDQRHIWLGRWEFHNLSHHYGKLNTYRYCRTRDMWFGKWKHGTSDKPKNKGYVTDKWEPLSHHCFNFDTYSYCGTEAIKFLVCHVTSRDHIIKWICNLASGSHSP